MLRTTNHSRNKWLTRGDPSKTLKEAWEDGIGAELEGYDYEEARFDPDGKAFILRWQDEIRTVLEMFDSVEYRLKIPVECFECEAHHHNMNKCPECGSDKWRCR